MTIGHWHLLFASFGLYQAALSIGAFARTFTVKNACSYTVWPAIFTDLNAGTSVPNYPTGWEASPQSSVVFNVPDDWKSGRIWGRTNCNFGGSGGNGGGPNSCATGGCNGGLQCDPHTGTGVAPVTLAEWTLQADGKDFYDISLVDGFNLAMSITNNAGCGVASCPIDLNAQCPSQLIAVKDASGKTLSCNNACRANLDGNPANSPSCCSGQYDSPTTCPSSGVEFYSFFKGACPNSYVYAYDEGSGTALWNCSSAKKADYTLTFCPSVQPAATR